MFRDDRAVYGISAVTEMTGVSQQALRGYEDKGLIAPHRTDGGTRRYSHGDIDRLHRIRELLSVGLNLEGIRRVLELEDEVERLRDENVRLRRLRATVSTGPSRTRR